MTWLKRLWEGEWVTGRATETMTTDEATAWAVTATAGPRLSGPSEDDYRYWMWQQKDRARREGVENLPLDLPSTLVGYRAWRRRNRP